MSLFCAARSRDGRPSRHISLPSVDVDAHKEGQAVQLHKFLLIRDTPDLNYRSPVTSHLLLLKCFFSSGLREGLRDGTYYLASNVCKKHKRPSE